MVENVTTSGTLKISNEADRVTIASILYKNGYAVKPFRFKKNGKSYEYCVQFSLENPETTGGSA